MEVRQAAVVDAGGAVIAGQAERGISVCRGCGSRTLTSVLDLGLMPIANELPTTSALNAERFPLHLRICRSCFLGQVGEAVPRERLFSAEYPYFSGTSSTWAAHCRELVVHLISELKLEPGDLCVEIASNDGTLLAAAADRGLRVLGVEPAKSVADVAGRRGVPTVRAFFGADTARLLRETYGAPRVVIANNVLAHVPDLEDFLDGLAVLAGPDTTIVMENPDLLTMLENGYFDTIYHEHFSYLSTHAVVVATRRARLQLVRVERVETHGGSLRWWLAPEASRVPDWAVQEDLRREVEGGIADEGLYVDFAKRARRVVDDLVSWLGDAAERGERVAAYGAAAKGMTLLGAARVTADEMVYVSDAAAAKQGRFVPGSDIPIAAPQRLLSDPPDRVLVLPWNIAEEIGAQVSALAPEAQVWTAVPALRQLGSGR